MSPFLTQCKIRKSPTIVIVHPEGAMSDKAEEQRRLILD